MALYMENGYVDIQWILDLGLPYNFVVGGRGSGKTFTALDTLDEDDIKFMLMRRTQTQTDMINKPEFSPFKKINSLTGKNIGTVTISKYNAAFYHMVDNGEKKLPEGEPIGYTCALSTIANMRGFDASDVKVLLYDEFIPESHERPLKNEGDAFLNAYETINRNRELEGEKPLQVLCLANANDLSNPIFVRLELVEIAYKMCKNRQEVFIDRDRGVGIFMLFNSPISKQKAGTALYKSTKRDSFAKMALDNVFDYQDESVKSMPLKEYIPLLKVGEISIYEHKKRREYYVTQHAMHNCPTFGTTQIDLRRMIETYGYLISEYLELNVIFEKVVCEVLFKKYFRLE